MPIHYLTAEELDALYGMFEEENGENGETAFDSRTVESYGPGFVSIEEAATTYADGLDR